MGITKEDSYNVTPKIREPAQAPVLISEVEIRAKLGADDLGAVEAWLVRRRLAAAREKTVHDDAER
jgi:hypothetical protein